LIWRNSWHGDDGIKTHHEVVPLHLDEEEEEEDGIKKMPNVMSRVAGPVAAVPTYYEWAAPAHPLSEGAINPALRVQGASHGH